MVRLKVATRSILLETVEAAWLNTAPKKLIEKYGER